MKNNIPLLFGAILFISIASTASALTPEQARIRARAIGILKGLKKPPAPTTAYPAVAGVIRPKAPLVATPKAAYPVADAVYASPAPRADVYKMPLPDYYYAQWARPALKICHGNTQQECLRAAAEVQGNSMGTPKNTCQWLDYLPVDRRCAMVQLP